MAKKKFSQQDGEIKLSNAIKNINSIKDDTRTAILDLEESPDPHKATSVINLINEDNLLATEERTALVDQVRKQFITLFNFKNCPDDYESLKSEAKFLAGITQYSFLLMAQRLKKIKDKHLYVKDGYADFKEFINEEIKISRTTAYNYIGIVNFFDLESVMEDEVVQYTKLVPVLPLLKADNKNIPKKQLMSRFLSEIKEKSRDEIIAEVKELKIKYGLSKKPSRIQKFEELANHVRKVVPLKLNDDEKEIIRKIHSYLQSCLED